ncbi:MAG: IS110 family transposase, partial [Pseudomonadota bacterium]
SMETTAIFVVVDAGNRITEVKVESTPTAIARALANAFPVQRAVIETGRVAAAICPGLRELGIPVVCINAVQAHQSLKTMKTNKTDPGDPAGLAQLARTGFTKEVHVKPATAQGMRSVITARSHLVEARVRLDNAIRGLCAAVGLKVDAGPRKNLVAEVASLLGGRKRLAQKIKGLDRVLIAFSRRSSACQILMSIPGVGVQTAAAFAAAVDDAGRFKRSRSAGSTFGLVPKRHQSGELDWVGRITKQHVIKRNVWFALPVQRSSAVASGFGSMYPAAHEWVGFPTRQ